MTYMLDTNTCIFTIKNHPASVRQRLEALDVGQVLVSSIVVAELAFGVAVSSQHAANQLALNTFLEFVDVDDWPASAAATYAEIRAGLRAAGTPIGAMDLLIAAHAKHRAATLVTDNLREFERVAGLRVENWLPR